MTTDSTAWEAASMVLGGIGLAVGVVFIPVIGFFLSPIVLMGCSYYCMHRANRATRAAISGWKEAPQ
ncbi:MAG: hypothetical protein V4510_06635 [bacterium]